MATRLKARHQDDVRAKIQTSQLINRLTEQALNPDVAEISPTRLKAIEILLRKSLPDLSAVTHSGDENNPVRSVQRIELVALGKSDNSKD